MANYWYIFGGSSLAGAITNQVERFDLATETWSVLGATLNHNKCCFLGSMESHDGSKSMITLADGYAGGTIYHETELFDTQAETLAMKTANPSSHGLMYACRGVGLGKYGITNSGKSRNTNWEVIEQYRYDILVDVWETWVDSLYCHRHHSSMQQGAYKFWVMSGQLSPYCTGGTSVSNKTLEVQTWNGSATVKGTQPQNIYGRDSIALTDDYGYNYGGRGYSGTVNRVDQLEFNVDTWVNKTGMLSSLERGVAIRNVAGTYGYYVGGYNYSTSIRYRETSKYDRDGDSWSPIVGGDLNQVNIAMGVGSNFTASPSGQRPIDTYLETFLDNPWLNIYHHDTGVCEYYCLDDVGAGSVEHAPITIAATYGHAYDAIQHPSKQTVYSSAQGKYYHMWRLNGNNDFRMFTTTDKKIWVDTGWAVDLIHQGGYTLELRDNANILYICMCATYGGNAGVWLLEWNTVTQTKEVGKDWVRVHTVSKGGGVHSIDRNNTNNHVVTYGGDCWRYSTDNGITWSAERDIGYVNPPEADPSKCYKLNWNHHWNHQTERIEAIAANTASGESCLDRYYYSFVDNLWHYIDEWQESYNGGHPIGRIDFTIDQNNGDQYLVHNFGRRVSIWQIRVDDSKEGLVNFDTHVGSSGGVPAAGVGWTDKCWIYFAWTTLVGAMVSLNPEVCNYGFFMGYSNQYADQFTNPEYNFNIIPRQAFKAGTSVYSISDYQPVMFNHGYPYGDPYDITVPVGPPILVFLPIIKSSDRKPDVGRTVQLRDADTGALLISMAEHNTYKGLYYGTLAAQFSMRFVDVYVDAVKQDNFSPMALVPSDRWPRYRQQ